MPPRARVLVADDHLMFREAVERYLTPQYDVVPGVGSIAELECAFALGGFDIALLDLSWGAEGGIFHRIPRLLERQPGVRILLLTAYDDWGLCRGALQSGAHGFLVKGSRLDDLLPGIEAALAGQQYISRLLRDPAPRRYHKRTRKLSQLDFRVLQLLADGMTCRQVAKVEGRRPKAIRYHMTQIRHAYSVPADQQEPWQGILTMLQPGDVEE